MSVADLRGLSFHSKTFEVTPAESIAALLKTQGAKIVHVDQKPSDKKEQLSLNIKNKQVRKFVLKHLIPRINILFESFRPGVMESLGLGPQDVHAINPNIIYVRITGFGHTPLHPNEQISAQYLQRAGRDINYLAASGLLTKFRRNNKDGQPVVPSNILSFYAAGTYICLTQIL